MSPRRATPSTLPPLTSSEEAQERDRLLGELNIFANRTGAEAGDDVLRWFDCRLRSELERQEHAARKG